MQATGVLPTSYHVYEIAGRLFGEETLVSEAAAPQKFDAETIHATYIGEDGVTRAALLCDIEFAARAGASLTMFPVDLVEESIKTKVFSQTLQENLQEVLNICVNLFMDAFSDRLHLGQIGRGESGFDERSKVVLASKQRADFDIDIPRYGRGKIALIIAKAN